jgi:RimJ/RimL family protein N-acetyltransferase
MDGTAQEELAMTNTSETTRVQAEPEDEISGDPDRDVIMSPVISDEEYELLAEWAAWESGALANGCREYSRPEDFRKVVEEGSAHLLMVRNAGQPVGAVTWEAQRAPGNYTVGVIIGMHELWGSGYGTIAMSDLLEFLFHSKNAHRVQITAAAYNKTMMKIFRSGFIRIEGILRDYYFFDGEYQDAVIGSILRDEYYKLLRGTDIDLVARAEKDEAYRILRQCLTEHPIGLEHRP